VSEDLILSKSSVGTYQSCHWRWYLQYVEGDRGEQSTPAAVGQAVHAGVEAYYKARLEHRASNRAEAEESLLLAWALEVPAILNPDPKLPLDKMPSVALRVLRAYIEDTGSVTVPKWVEYPGVVDINGIPWSFTIDLLDDALRVRDLKVKGQKPQEVSKHLFELTGYAIPVRFILGRKETDVIVDVMVRLKRDRPYHVQFSYGGPISDHDVDVFTRTLEEVAEGIARRHFEPTGLETGECKWCPVKFSCDYWAEYAQANPTGETDG
jgi:CRISPR/Cas system-associated exonuclease Cas4 (RecB family)